MKKEIKVKPAFSRNPQQIYSRKNEYWYYEDKRGLLVYSAEPNELLFVLPWKQLEKSIARKNGKKDMSIKDLFV